MSATRGSGQRAGLTRPQVLAAARGLLAERGLAALTMRALAARLSVTPNALYSHVEGKEALVDDLLDDALGSVRVPPDDLRDPGAGVHAVMTASYDALLDHRDLVPLYLARQGARGPNAQHLGDVVLALLKQADVHGERAREALRILIIHTIGFAAFTSNALASTGDPDGAHAAELAMSFDRSLTWLLTGIGPSVRPASGGRQPRAP